MDTRSNTAQAMGKAVALLLLIALVLRLPYLDAGPWFDELWVMEMARRLHWHDYLFKFGFTGNQPFYGLVSWFSLNVFGHTVWAVRLPALIFGLASIWALWRLAAAVTSREEALFSTLLLTVSYHHVWFSQNGRGYTMLLLFTLTATDAFLRILNGDGRKHLWLIHGLSLALGMLTHVSCAFVLMTHGLVWLVLAVRPALRRQADMRAVFWALLLSSLIVVVLNSGILVDMITFLPNRPRKVTEVEWMSFLWTIKAMVLSLKLGLVPGLLALTAALLVFAVGLIDYWKRDWRLPVLFFLPGAFVVVASIALGRHKAPRFFFFLGGFVLLVVVRGLSRVCSWASARCGQDRRASIERGLRYGVAALAMLLSIALLPQAYGPKQDFEGARRYVEQHRAPGERVMALPSVALVFREYYRLGYKQVESERDLERGLLLYSQASFVRSAYPALMAELERRGQEVARFEGTVGGGDIVVLRIR